MKLEQAFQCFKSACESGRLAHAFVVACRPRTSGRLFADKVISYLFCPAGDERPCGKCDSCLRVAARTHPDVVWVEPQLKSRRIAIEEVRQLQQFVYQTSYSGDWKACVISAADRMSDEAANAFLKTLEEPPKRRMFLLLTDSPDALLSTILSRGQKIDISSDETELDEKWKARLLDILSTSAEGSGIPSAVWTAGLTHIFRDMKDEAESETAQETQADEAGMESGGERRKEMIEARAGARYRELRTAAMREIMFWYRDVLLLACGGSRDLIYNKMHFDILSRMAGRASVQGVLSSLRAIEGMCRQMERNLPDASVVLDGFGRIMRS